jgi:hypothetical protein
MPAFGPRCCKSAAYLAGALELVASTVGRVLPRHQVPHLSAIDPSTGAPATPLRVRYERPRPGDLLHIDIKMLGRSPTAAAGDSTAAGKKYVAAQCMGASATTTCTSRSVATHRAAIVDLSCGDAAAGGMPREKSASPGRARPARNDGSSIGR